MFDFFFVSLGQKYPLIDCQIVKNAFIICTCHGFSVIFVPRTNTLISVIAFLQTVYNLLLYFTQPFTLQKMSSRSSRVYGCEMESHLLFKTALFSFKKGTFCFTQREYYSKVAIKPSNYFPFILYFGLGLNKQVYSSIEQSLAQ